GEEQAESHQNAAEDHIPIGKDPAPPVEVRTIQPRPDRALVICEVACAQIAEVLGLVLGMCGIERAWAIRRQEPLVHDVDDRTPTWGVEDGMWQRDREQLVRSDRSVVAVLRVDDVAEAAG